MRKKHLNLYRSHHRFRARPGAGGWLRAFYMPAAALLLAGLCAAGVVRLQNRALARQITALERQMEAEGPRYEEAQAKWAYNEALMARRAAVEALSKTFAAYPAVTGGLVDKIAAVGDGAVTMTLKGWDSERGRLDFRAESPRVMDIPGYVEALRKTGLFAAVDYTGYRYEREVYVLDLACVLRGGEGP